MKKYPYQINFRADTPTLERLRELCAYARLSQGALLRYLIQQAWLNTFPVDAPHEPLQ